MKNKLNLANQIRQALQKRIHRRWSPRYAARNRR